jgi:hypothetical protein
MGDIRTDKNDTQFIPIFIKNDNQGQQQQQQQLAVVVLSGHLTSDHLMSRKTEYANTKDCITVVVKAKGNHMIDIVSN